MRSQLTNEARNEKDFCADAYGRMSWKRAERLHHCARRRLLSPLLIVADSPRIPLLYCTYPTKQIMSTSRSRWFAMTMVAGLGIGASSVALAHVDVGVSIGVPGVAYAPEAVYAPPPPVYVEPPAAVVISPGWYGDRYYDGRRYWERREWQERHRGEREWHDARDYRGDPRGGWGHDHDGGWRGDWHRDQGDDGRRHDH